jgi:hypothetical protein
MIAGRQRWRRASAPRQAARARVAELRSARRTRVANDFNIREIVIPGLLAHGHAQGVPPGAGREFSPQDERILRSRQILHAYLILYGQMRQRTLADPVAHLARIVAFGYPQDQEPRTVIRAGVAPAC